MGGMVTVFTMGLSVNSGYREAAGGRAGFLGYCSDGKCVGFSGCSFAIFIVWHGIDAQPDKGLFHHLPETAAAFPAEKYRLSVFVQNPADKGHDSTVDRNDAVFPGFGFDPAAEISCFSILIQKDLQGLIFPDAKAGVAHDQDHTYRV